MRRLLVLLMAVMTLAAAVVLSATPSTAAARKAGLTFKITVSKNVTQSAVTGRAYVIITRSIEDEPRFQIDPTGVPFFGKDVHKVRPGRTLTISDGGGTYGYPLRSFRQLPRGTYYVQAFFNVYTRFDRSDGSVVWLHMPGGDGQDPFSSPGNFYSEPRRISLNPRSARTIRLTLDQLIQPSEPVPPGGTAQQGNPADSAHVKHVKIQSTALTQFWGTPMYIGADVLLPEGYDASTDKYPVVYLHGHYPGGNPYGFVEDLSNDFSQWWVAPTTPKMIVVQFRHENPYYDDSYGVNSANLGPYGDAITKELMPEIDARFRTINERWARSLTGGSTGGWIALAHMVLYSDLYQGVWVRSPDPVDFRFHQLVNVYSDPNAYFTIYDWMRVPRPASRTIPGDTRLTMEQENHWELALGTRGRSGLGQWDIWQAVYGPQGPDGYPARVWNKLTGAIDHTVAEAWKPMDLRLQLEQDWATLGPNVSGRMHIFAGDDDNFFLNNAVELLEQSLTSMSNPPANAEFQYGHNQGHSWWPYTMPELLTLIYNSMQP